MTTHNEATVLAEFGPADENGDHVVWSVRAHNVAAALAEARNEIARVRPIVEAARELVRWWDGESDDRDSRLMLDRMENAVRAADATIEPKERTDAK